MWKLFDGRNGATGSPGATHALFHEGEPSAIHHRRRALAEAGRWLSDALGASPHAVYLRTGSAFEPAVVSGIENAPAFSVRGSLPRALNRTGGPVMTTRSHRARLFEAALDPVDRASLRRADAIALVPLSQDRELEAFLLVGGPLRDFDPERLARALAPVSARLRTARDGAPRPGSESPFPAAKDALDPAFSLS